jgi:hypothetical protein
VYGVRDWVSLARPKSAILMEKFAGVDGGVTSDEYRLKLWPVSVADEDTRIFSGLMSRWKKWWS